MKSFFIIFLLCIVILPAYGTGVEIVTGRGNVFLLDETVFNGTGVGTGNGESMLDGIGINSRLVHHENSGILIHGTGLTGEEHSIQPYNDIDSDTDFVVAAFNSDNVVEMQIPEFYHRYLYHAGQSDSDNTQDTAHMRLVRLSGDEPNVLGYSESREISGDVQTNLDDGITIQGTGRTILRLPEYNQDMILAGSLSEGTTIRLAKSPYDLVDLTHIDVRGFLIHYCRCNPGTGTLDVLAGSVDDSRKSAKFQYDQSASVVVYHGKCCKGRYIASGSDTQTVFANLVIQPHESGYLVVQGDTTNPRQMNIEDVKRPGAKEFRPPVFTIDNFKHWIYDTLPIRELRSFSGTFEERLIIPPESYLIVDSAGGSSKIRGTVLGERNFIEISGLENTGYRITRDGATISAGIVSDEGTIIIPPFEDNAFSSASGRLHLYTDSIMYVRDSEIGMVALDHVNDVIIPVPSKDNRVYSTHAYVKMPVIGTAEITGMSLDETLNLGYLDDTYQDGQSIMIPIIPTYKRIHLAINGVETSLGIADVLGGTGLFIADPVSSTITVNRPGEFTHNIQSTTGAVTYMIATNDGNAKAHIQATVSGESEITNTRKYTKNPPPPPPPRPRDPLTTWVEVYVNGQIHQIDGQDRTQIFFSDIPVQGHKATKTAISSTHIARFSYPEVKIFDTISVPVNEADFVEFYFYNMIYAEGSIPPLPPGYSEYQRGSSASATAVLGYASINTSM